MNASWGGPAFSQALYGAIKRAGDAGVLVVAAAGNDGVNADSQPDYPAAFDLPNVVSVAATDRSDQLLGLLELRREVGRPGGAGRRRLLDRADRVGPSGYASFSGTSMAAPFVSGAAALYLSKFPQASVDQIKRRADADGRTACRRWPARRSAAAGSTSQGAGRSVALDWIRARHHSPFGLLP